MDRWKMISPCLDVDAAFDGDGDEHRLRRLGDPPLAMAFLVRVVDGPSGVLLDLELPGHLGQRLLTTAVIVMLRAPRLDISRHRRRASPASALAEVVRRRSSDSWGREGRPGCTGRAS